RTIRVTPKPASPPLVLVGGSTEKAARRAARLRSGFFPAIGDPRLAEVYRAECQRLGFDGGLVHLPIGPGFVHVTETPARDWAGHTVPALAGPGSRTLEREPARAGSRGFGRLRQELGRSRERDGTRAGQIARPVDRRVEGRLDAEDAHQRRGMSHPVGEVTG